jgi:murein DD-endopeptidase MepM/ murein hydrolase activator NlpD
MFSLFPSSQLHTHEYGFQLLRAGKMMLMVGLFSNKKSLVQLHWPTVVGGMLAAWLAAYTVMASAGGVQAGSGASVSVTDQSPDFLVSPEKSWLSHANLSKRAYAAMVDSADESFAAPGSYFRALTRVYGASTEHQAPEQTEQVTSVVDEPMPLDEVAKFHQLETHMPIALARVTSEFGHRPNPLGKGHVFHRGIDLAAPVGTPVYAVAAGTVIRASRDRTYGNVVVIDHHNGYKTLYAHNSKLLVKVGERVKPGQSIAKVGSTGHSTGPHLHFEIHRSGQRVDPGPYLAAL